MQAKSTYAVWICMMLFTEGGHFTIMPNALKKIYGETATGIYGFIFTFTGLSNLLILFVVKSSFGQDYTNVYYLTAALSLVALTVLIFGFTEEKLAVWDTPQTDYKLDIDDNKASNLEDRLLDSTEPSGAYFNNFNKIIKL